jgi:2-dehydro-3-deoxyphosphogluconate aldolase / (4S)-4-hydroxy-2-oxoglutarate aldolase
MEKGDPLQDWLGVLRENRVIAVIRTLDLKLGLGMAQAVAAAGIRLIEVTWNSEHPAHLVATLRAELPHCWIGCGTLLNLVQMQEAMAAGAQFGFMPHVAPDLIRYAQERYWPIHPGALTPSEIVLAWQSGASAVKVFPVSAVGGDVYIRSLQGPLGQIPLIPTGGVTFANAQSFLAAGAIAIGLSGELFPQSAVNQQDWPFIIQRTEQWLATLTHFPLANCP